MVEFFTSVWATFIGVVPEPYLVAAIAAFVTALGGGLLTDISPWYKALKMPSWKPPDWAFGPIWTVIFTLAVIAAGLAWEACETRNQRITLLAVFGINAVLNAAWSYFYFILKRPDWAFIELILLWLSVLAIAVVSYQLVPKAGFLLIPYLVWVTIAGCLNWQTVRLNAPFEHPVKPYSEKL